MTSLATDECKLEVGNRSLGNSEEQQLQSVLCDFVPQIEDEHPKLQYERHDIERRQSSKLTNQCRSRGEPPVVVGRQKCCRLLALSAATKPF